MASKEDAVAALIAQGERCYGHVLDDLEQLQDRLVGKKKATVSGIVGHLSSAISGLAQMSCALEEAQGVAQGRSRVSEYTLDALDEFRDQLDVAYIRLDEILEVIVRRSLGK